MANFLKARFEQKREKSDVAQEPKKSKEFGEVLLTPEQERSFEEETYLQAESLETGNSVVVSAVPQSHIEPLKNRVAAPLTKSERLQAIERIMSDGLDELYITLPPDEQKRIKESGEQAATAIEQLIESGKVAAKKVLHIIHLWLKKIPGVNAYFLEQESKIKTDKILAVTRNRG